MTVAQYELVESLYNKVYKELLSVQKQEKRLSKELSLLKAMLDNEPIEE